MKNKQLHERDFTAFIRLLAPYLKENLLAVITVASLIFLSNVLLLAIPPYISTSIDSLLGEQVDFPVLYHSCFYMILFSTLAFASEFVRNFLMVRVTQKVILHLRRDVFSHLMRLKISVIEDSNRGDIMNRISIDIEQISSVISNDMVQILAGIITVVGSFFMMTITSIELTSVYLIIIPLLAITAKHISRITKQSFRKSKSDMGKMSGHVEEMFAADKTVKMFALEEKSYHDFEHFSDEYAASSAKSHTWGGYMMPASNSLNNFGFTMIVVWGCLLVMNAKLTVGTISGFIVYSKKFSGPIIETANIYNTLQSALSSCERILYILNAEEEPDTGLETETLKGSIVFDHVSFGYDPNVKILKDINFEVKPGERVAIVGHTGCGKTTLISLLMRFYDVKEGQIRIDGKDIKDYNLNSLRTNFGLVLQENFLFDMSILENIDYGLESHDVEKIKAAIREVSMDTFIESLDDAYDTELSYENTAISQGQIQLLVIARAMLLNPSIYIFDEATSNVDLITEQKIKKVMNKILEGKTAFIIAHRLSTISNCDKIIVLDQGNIMEMGTHEELLAQEGMYYRMVNLH